jgi:ribosome modulation factor
MQRGAAARSRIVCFFLMLEDEQSQTRFEGERQALADALTTVA